MHLRGTVHLKRPTSPARHAGCWVGGSLPVKMWQPAVAFGALQLSHLPLQQLSGMQHNLAGTSEKEWVRPNCHISTWNMHIYIYIYLFSLQTLRDCLMDRCASFLRQPHQRQIVMFRAILKCGFRRRFFGTNRVWSLQTIYDLCPLIPSLQRWLFDRRSPDYGSWWPSCECGIHNGWGTRRSRWSKKSGSHSPKSSWRWRGFATSRGLE